MMKSLIAVSALTVGVAAEGKPPPQITVSLPSELARNASGRLLIFMEPANAENAAADRVDVAGPDAPDVSIAATDVVEFGAGRAIAVDLQHTTHMRGGSDLLTGSYRVQAVLDCDGNYGYAGRSAGDLVSQVAKVQFPLQSSVSLALDHPVPPEPGQFDTAGLPPIAAAQIAASRPHLHEEHIASPSLTRFYGTPQSVAVWVLTPPGYDPAAQATYPAVYTAGGFGTSHKLDGQLLSKTWHMMETGEIPPMIWVALDYGTRTGTTEFVDSANNGPWGKALINEIIPALERRYRMDARPTGRFLTGHSSGGWFALSTMGRYPAMFGGCWATSPDPVDFHDFLGVDLYASGANMYRDATGTLRPLERDHGKVLLTIEQEAKQEGALGRDGIGGQLRSFEWVFSPRRADGRPAYLFDRSTGRIDPAVARYWGDHYDISRRMRTEWPRLKRDLDGKVHVRVGTEDSIYLEGSVHRLEASLRKVGASPDISYAPGATHSLKEVYARDGVANAYWREMTAEMQVIARGRIGAGPH